MTESVILLSAPWDRFIGELGEPQKNTTKQTLSSILARSVNRSNRGSRVTGSGHDADDAEKYPRTLSFMYPLFRYRSWFRVSWCWCAKHSRGQRA